MADFNPFSLCRWTRTYSESPTLIRVPTVGESIEIDGPWPLVFEPELVEPVLPFDDTLIPDPAGVVVSQLATMATPAASPASRTKVALFMAGVPGSITDFSSRAAARHR